MSQRSFHVRWIFLGFLLSGGFIGILANLIPSSWLVPYIIVTVSTWCAAVATYGYFVFVKPSRSRAMVWTPPTEEKKKEQVLTPVSVAELAESWSSSISGAIDRVFSPPDAADKDDDDLGEREMTGEEFDAEIGFHLWLRDVMPPEGSRTREAYDEWRYARFLSDMSFAESDKSKELFVRYEAWLSEMHYEHSRSNVQHWYDDVELAREVLNKAP